MGVEIIDNRLYGGSGTLVAGSATAARIEGNQAFAHEDAAAPQPAVSSIYEWQLGQMAGKERSR